MFHFVFIFMCSFLFLFLFYALLSRAILSRYVVGVFQLFCLIYAMLLQVILICFGFCEIIISPVLGLITCIHLDYTAVRSQNLNAKKLQVILLSINTVLQGTTIPFFICKFLFYFTFLNFFLSVRFLRLGLR